MPKTITTASALSTKASKALDLMRARAVKADEARTAAGPSWPTAPGTGGRAPCDSRVGRTRAGRLPPVGGVVA